MANVRIPQGFWTALAVVFALIFLLLLLKGMVLVAIVSLAMAVFTGAEASGHGVLPGRDKPRETT